MNLQQLRSTLHQKIDQADPNFLHILHDLTNAYTKGETAKIKEIEKLIFSTHSDSYAPVRKKKKKEKKVKRAYSLADLEKNMEPW